MAKKTTLGKTKPANTKTEKKAEAQNETVTQTPVDNSAEKQVNFRHIMRKRKEIRN